MVTFISFALLVLVPKSLPVLNVGRFKFGWGVGDLLLFSIFYFVFFGELIRKNKVFVGCMISVNRSVILYFLTLVFPLIIGMIRFPNEIILEIGAYIKYFQAFMIYYLVRKLVYREWQIKISLLVFVFVTIGVLIISVIQFFFPDKYVTFWQTINPENVSLDEDFLLSVRSRLSGPFFNPNSLGYFLLISFPILWWIYTEKKKYRVRFFYVILIIISLLVLVFTGSREAYIAFIFCFLTYIYLQKVKILNFRFFIIFMLIVIILYFQRFYLYQRIVMSTFDDGYLSIASLSDSPRIRIELWKASIFSLSKYGLIGIGFSQNAKALSEFMLQNSLDWVAGSHNMYLRAFVEGGVLGFIFFTYMLLKIWSIRKYACPQGWEKFNYAFLAGFIGIVVAGIFGEPFQDKSLVIPFFYLLGVTMSIIELKKESNKNIEFSKDTLSDSLY